MSSTSKKMWLYRHIEIRGILGSQKKEKSFCVCPKVHLVLVLFANTVFWICHPPFRNPVPASIVCNVHFCTSIAIIKNGSYNTFREASVKVLFL